MGAPPSSTSKPDARAASAVWMTAEMSALRQIDRLPVELDLGVRDASVGRDLGLASRVEGPADRGDVGEAAQLRR